MKFTDVLMDIRTERALRHTAMTVFAFGLFYFVSPSFGAAVPLLTVVGINASYLLGSFLQSAAVVAVAGFFICVVFSIGFLGLPGGVFAAYGTFVASVILLVLPCVGLPSSELARSIAFVVCIAAEYFFVPLVESEFAPSPTVLWTNVYPMLLLVSVALVLGTCLFYAVPPWRYARARVHSSAGQV